ncbi:MAG: biotin-dependent carboxyltransferase family protein [Gemmatimonadota bacterium]|nr:biotin-dependent carboxyltransferase family protein [Gemmatimonadota bacterium]
MSITVVRAAPYLTVQDFGRTRYREFGVPRCGAMDRYALGAANSVLGNDPECAGLEWALGGGVLRFDTACRFAIGGATADASLDAAAVSSLTAFTANAGDALEIGRFTSGRFLYVAVEGGILIEQLLGSGSTYLPAHFGGVEGRLMKSGDILPVGPSATPGRPDFSAPDGLRIDYSRSAIRVIPGPQWSLFSESDRTLFFSQQYTVSRSSDRMGYRLEGAPLSAELGLLPSEAVCEGTIQLPPDGLPIVLMADSPTVGGYPKIGVVSATDLPVLAQRNPGGAIRFELTTVEDAQRRLRRSAASLFTLGSLASKA